MSALRETADELERIVPQRAVAARHLPRDVIRQIGPRAGDPVAQELSGAARGYRSYQVQSGRPAFLSREDLTRQQDVATRGRPRVVPSCARLKAVQGLTVGEAANVPGVSRSLALDRLVPRIPFVCRLTFAREQPLRTGTVSR
jgi:hypothetical protein